MRVLAVLQIPAILFQVLQFLRQRKVLGAAAGQHFVRKLSDLLLGCIVGAVARVLVALGEGEESKHLRRQLQVVLDIVAALDVARKSGITLFGGFEFGQNLDTMDRDSYGKGECD